MLDAGARVIHVDVMDGHFVPPITIGPLVAAAIADQVHDAGGAVDVHLMIERPERQIAEFAKRGRRLDHLPRRGDRAREPDRWARSARPAASPGIALNPGTPVEAVGELGGAADLVLCMSVNPGLGRAALHRRPRRTSCARLAELMPGALIEVDGGVDPSTAGPVAEAGATLLVAGLGDLRRRGPGGGLRRDRRGGGRGRGGQLTSVSGGVAGALSAPASSCHQARSAWVGPGAATRRAHHSASRRRPPTASSLALVTA